MSDFTSFALAHNNSIQMTSDDTISISISDILVSDSDSEIDHNPSGNVKYSSSQDGARIISLSMKEQEDYQLQYRGSISPDKLARYLHQLKNGNAVETEQKVIVVPNVISYNGYKREDELYFATAYGGYSFVADGALHSYDYIMSKFVAMDSVTEAFALASLIQQFGTAWKKYKNGVSIQEIITVD